MAYYDAMARANHRQQERFTEGQRYKRYYEAFRSPGASGDAAVRYAFRPAAGLMVLVTRMQWDATGEPYVPGSLQAWSAILRQNPYRLVREWGKKSTGWQYPDQLAEADVAFSRLENDKGPLQAYLCLSEIDRVRPPAQRMSDQMVVSLADKFADFSDQYLIFAEFRANRCLHHPLPDDGRGARIRSPITRCGAMPWGPSREPWACGRFWRGKVKSIRAI